MVDETAVEQGWRRVREADLENIAAPSSPLLVCFSHLRWGFVWQRPQHLMSRAAEDYAVFFVEEPYQSAVDAPVLELHRPMRGVVVATPATPFGFDAEQTRAALERLIADHLEQDGRRPAILWYYTPAALAFTGGLRADVIVYDNMDELSLFRDADRSLLGWEGRLLTRADLVFTGGVSLYEAKRVRHERVHCFPSSVEVAHFAAARDFPHPEPADQVDIPHPRLGFFGVVDERVDLELLQRLADLQPEWSFCMIGPVMKIDESDLPRRANIHWLGMKAYADLPQYLAGWDVGALIFAINDATRFISPTKTPEFLAAGVPVVSTPIADVVRCYGRDGLVEIAEDAPCFVAKARMLMERPKAPWLKAVDDRLQGQSWTATWAAMRALIDDHMRGAVAAGETVDV